MTNDGRFALFEGKLDDYERLAPLSGFPDILSPDRSMEMAKLTEESQIQNEKPAETLREQQQDFKREKQKLERSKEKIESEIFELNEKIKHLEARLEKEDPSNYKKIEELDKELKKYKNKLLANEEIWLEIESQILKLS
jgi:ATP-binding cassette subfamily F protein 3